MSRKPKDILIYEGRAECVTEVPEWNEAFGVNVEAFIYTAKDARRLIKFLIKAELWLKNKELYKPKGRKPRESP